MADILNFRHADLLKDAWRHVRLEFAADAHRLNPKHSHGSSPSSCSNLGLYQAGMTPADFQLDTAGGVTPANAAALSLPPSAWMMSRTDFMPRCITKFLNGCQILKINVEHSEDLSVDFDMGPRDEIIARLRQLPEVLGKTDGEIAEILGIPQQAWSNYKAEKIQVTIRPMVALAMWDAFGIPMEWVYDGQTARTPDPDMRAKLVAANRRADAWLASRRNPGGHRVRILAIMVAGALFYTGEGVHSHGWKRTDGRPMSLTAFVAERRLCNDVAGTANFREGATPLQTAIFHVCMTDRGYGREN